MFISEALAQGAPAGGAPGFDPTSLLPIVLIFVVFYFLLFRPQQKKIKAHREMMANLRRGDKVLTAGGIYGKISRVVSDTEVEIDIAPNVRVSVAKMTISEVIAKTEPAADESKDTVEKK